MVHPRCLDRWMDLEMERVAEMAKVHANTCFLTYRITLEPQGFSRARFFKSTNQTAPRSRLLHEAHLQLTFYSAFRLKRYKRTCTSNWKIANGTKRMQKFGAPSPLY